MKYWWRLLGVAALWVMAGLALQAQTDRIFNGLTPTEGQAFSVPLATGKTYTQTLKVPRTSLTKIGVWLAPLQKNVPASSVAIAIRQDEKVLRTVAIPLTTLARDGATYATIDPPLTIQRGTTLQLDFSVPPEATKVVAIQLRQPDDSFDASAIPFLIDGVAQPQPVALEAYSLYRPSFLVAIGLGLVALGLWWLTYAITWVYSWTIYVATLGAMVAIPGWLSHDLSLLLVLTVVVASSGMIWLLRRLAVGPPAIALGTNMWALTTWFALQELGQREYLLMWAALPYLVLALYAWRQAWPAVTRRSVGVVLAWCLFILFFGQHQMHMLPWQATASLRDVFFDPYQIMTAEKTIGAAVSWDHFGSYIGIVGPVLIALGLVWRSKRDWRLVVTGALALVIALWPPAIRTLHWLPIAPQHLLIIATFCLSYFAAWGIQGLHNYLRPSRLTTCLLWGIVTLAFLDVLYVWATVLEFTSL